MSDTKWTPGPWFNTSEDDSVIGEVMDKPLDSGVSMVVSIYGENAKRDARLIAAAPELYEALNAMLNDVGRASSLPSAIKARAALAKAREE